MKCRTIGNVNTLMQYTAASSHVSRNNTFEIKIVTFSHIFLPNIVDTQYSRLTETELRSTNVAIRELYYSNENKCVLKKKTTSIDSERKKLHVKHPLSKEVHQKK